MKKSLAAFAVAAVAAVASAQDTLVAWDTLGLTGDEPLLAGTASNAALEALNLVRGPGLNPSGAGNSFSSSGWEGTASGAASDEYFSFGFEVQDGFAVNLDSLIIGLRASNTGPGTIGLYYSGDGFSSALTTISLPGGAFVNEIVDLSGLTGLTGVVEFRLIEVGNTQADGSGETAEGGTLRIVDYVDNGTFIDTQFTGTVVPAPGAFALLGLGGLAAARRRRA